MLTFDFSLLKIVIIFWSQPIFIKKIGVAVSLWISVLVGVEWLKQFQVGLDPLTYCGNSDNCVCSTVLDPDTDTDASKQNVSLNLESIRNPSKYASNMELIANRAYYKLPYSWSHYTFATNMLVV